ncbi:hypothetical protein BGW80DRAFT_1566152 [Lactifluus volemus]|nr:hypothetical protein BGW80DRAFT_1566152 [Lactifluus volemus]
MPCQTKRTPFNRIVITFFGSLVVSIRARVLTQSLSFYPSASYVFENNTWDKAVSGDISSVNDKRRIPARGAYQFFVATSIPCAPAVVPEFFKEVCANRTIIDCKKVNATLLDTPATTIVQTWIDKLERTEDRCVEFIRRLEMITRHMALSRHITDFSRSPLITAALAENAQIIHPAFSHSTSSAFTPSSGPGHLSGLLALHIRRLPRALQESCQLQPGNALHEEYRAHFFPEIDDIVTRVREVRASLLPIMKLTRVYVLTNGRPWWLKYALPALFGISSLA